MSASRKKTIWNFAENLEGDKVIWMIVMFLIFSSIVCIFSSSSRLLEDGQTRLDIVGDQVLTVIFGLALIVGLYNIRNLKFFRWCSKWGFLVSVVFLVLLDIHVRLPFMRAIEINGAWRILKIAGFQVHVFEIVKVAMVMYMAWAVEKVKKGPCPLLDSLKDNPKLKFLSGKKARKWIYLYLPFIVVFLMVLPGSNSSALFIAGIMFLTILIGGGEWKEMAKIAAIGVGLLAVCTGLYFISSGKIFKRIGTGITRIVSDNSDYEKMVIESKPGSREYQLALDKIHQPYSAKIAVKQGGLIGRGAGQSRQRYIVPDMSEDYMYSFIIEEYGLLGGIFILTLYVSLMARGGLLVRNCGQELFPKCAIAGLCLLITGQAFLHMLVNVDIGPMTGQTLPLISHGNSAFLCFSIAFGIILAISRIASRKMASEQKNAKSLVELHETVQGLDDLEAFENGNSVEDEAVELQNIDNEYDL